MQHISVNRWWAAKMIFCEVLNLLNCCLQIYLTHRFLGRQFLTLGIDFIHDDFQGNMDSLDIIFPKVTKCHFHKFGPSGSIQKHDGESSPQIIVTVYIFIRLFFSCLFIRT